mmetsp:Transcript_26929/g.62125  ORF Transcript_26929/g.62125 Transcript_26929/m.62125 type:complete len:608 (-) Transcript_26929:46-1869(-)
MQWQTWVVRSVIASCAASVVLYIAWICFIAAAWLRKMHGAPTRFQAMRAVQWPAWLTWKRFKVAWWGRETDALAVHIKRVVGTTQEARIRGLVRKHPLPLALAIALLLRDPSVLKHWDTASLATFYYFAFGWLGHSLIAMVVNMIWMLWPQACTQLRMRQTQALFCFLSIMLAVTSDDAMNFVLGIQTLCIIRVLMGILSSNVLHTGVMNIAVAVTNIVTYRRLLFTSSPTLAAVNHVLFGKVDMLQLGFLEASIAVSAVVVCHVLILHTRQEVAALVQAQVAAQSEHCIRCLLRSLCDAEIKLNASLEITEPAPALGGLLLTTSSLQGKNLADFIHEQDRGAFMELMEHKTLTKQEGSLTPAMHMQLVDETGSSVSVQIYSSTSTDALGQTVHHLGICERTADRGVPPAADGMEFLQGMPATNAFHWPPASDTISLSIASTTPELELWVDPMAPGLKVFQCTLALAMLLGRASTTTRWCLSKTIINSEMFMCRLQSCVQEAVYMDENTSMRAELGSFVFQPFYCGASRRSMFQAKCFMEGGLQRRGQSDSASQASNSGSDTAEVAVKIILTELTKLHKKPKHKRFAGNSGTSTTASKTALHLGTSL